MIDDDEEEVVEEFVLSSDDDDVTPVQPEKYKLLKDKLNDTRQKMKNLVGNIGNLNLLYSPKNLQRSTRIFWRRLP